MLVFPFDIPVENLTNVEERVRFEHPLYGEFVATYLSPAEGGYIMSRYRQGMNYIVDNGIVFWDFHFRTEAPARRMSADGYIGTFDASVNPYWDRFDLEVRLGGKSYVSDLYRTLSSIIGYEFIRLL